MSNIYIYSRGLYEQLNYNELEGKAIIRIHNLSDKKWYPEKEDGKLILFFNDLKINNISFIDKLKSQYDFETTCFMRQHVKEIKNYINKNKNKDLIIHCEYGKSRSVAISMYLRDYLKYKIINKEEKELTKYNDWVLLMLKKFY
jgi:predicted protein tyrosine phosphatase